MLYKICNKRCNIINKENILYFYNCIITVINLKFSITKKKILLYLLYLTLLYLFYLYIIKKSLFKRYFKIMLLYEDVQYIIKSDVEQRRLIPLASLKVNDEFLEKLQSNPENMTIQFGSTCVSKKIIYNEIKISFY